MNNPYVGVYSDVGAGTSVGTEVSKEVGPGVGNNLRVDDSKTKGRQYQVISRSTLEDADLNVAKIRLVTTLPGKEIPEEMRGKAYVGFILTGVQESHNEKVEVINLPGDTFASYFYGAAPRQFNFSGILLNTDQDQWRDSFEELYEKYLRGSVSTRNFSIVQVSYNGRVVSGWLTNLSQQLDSSNDHYSSFSFSVLVSRIDMAGGSKKFSDYLVTLSDDGGDFKGANIDADYAVLDPSNFNGMIDPIRTGMVIPPKRPHKARGKKKVSAGCWYPAETTEAGKATNTGAVTANNHINDATQCTVIEAIEGTNEKIQEALKKARELLATTDSAGKKRVPTQGDIDAAKKQKARAAALAASLKENMQKKEVKDQLSREARELTQYYQNVSKGLVTDATAAEVAEAKEALKRGRIDTGEASIYLTVENNRVSIAEVNFDPNTYDGTEATQYVIDEQHREFFSPKGRDENNQEVTDGGSAGLFDKAQRLREEKDRQDRETQEKKDAEASARRLAKRKRSG